MIEPQVPGRVEPVKPPRIVCFGEMLWDCLPDGLFPGGAPMNVAMHLASLGHAPLILSAVGKDFLGRELIRRLIARQVDTSLVTLHPEIETGVVMASLDDQGNASYQICQDVAWDHIPPPPESFPRPDAVVFGSLALRSHHNRAALHALLDRAGPHTLRVFDLNLRPPFDPPDRIRDWAGRATLLKMNQEEAAQLAGHSADPEPLARILTASYPHASICLTAGSRGAGLLHHGAWTWAEAPPVQVVDTVGAGDAFLAALIHGWLRHDPVETILRYANRVAAFVASARGATPPLPHWLRS